MEQTPITEWRVQEISEQTAQKVVEILCQRLGIEDLARARRNLDFLARKAEQDLNRRDDARHTAFAVAGGIVMLLAGYVGAAVNLKGHL